MPLVENVRELNKRIKFQKVDTVKDENGDLVEVVVDVGECWCKLKAQLLKEYRSEVGTTLEDTVTFVLRTYQTFIFDHTMTILFEGKMYSIIKSMPDATDSEFQAIIAQEKT